MLKAAICGFGALGHVHANSLCSIDGVEIRAVCDINPEQLKAKDVKFNIDAEQGNFDISGSNTYQNFEEMLAKEDLDIVVIATPSDLHADYTVAALDAGCNVFCEKPMSLTIENCDRMIEARNRNGRQLMIGQCLRFWAEYEFLLQCLKDERYGKLRSLTMERCGSFHAPGSWFNDGKRSGGAVLDLHVHDVDWVQMALGRPDRITARGLIGMTGAVDDITAVWEYGDSTMVTIHGSWMYNAFRMGYLAFFEKASVEYTLGADPAVKVTLPNRELVEDIELGTTPSYLKEMQYFVACVKGEHPNTMCPAESTRESIALAIQERDAALIK